MVNKIIFLDIFALGSFGGNILFDGENENCKRISEIDSFTLDMHKVTNVP